MAKSRVLIVWRAIFILGMVNFAVFLVVALMIGGDAVNGYRASGHFYVANHGKLTEVSESVWLYSRAHVFSVWNTHPVAIFAALMHQRASRNTSR